MVSQLLLTLMSFTGIWFGASLALSSVEKLSHRLRVSSFAASFLILGFFTSISEFSVGINSVLDKDPEIYVGNLIGASIVIFMLIIPLLAITGKQIKINPQLRGNNLVLPLIVIALPVLQSLDGVVDKNEGVVSIVLFIISSLLIQKKQGFLEDTTKFLHIKKVKIWYELAKIVLGIVVIFTCSHLVVELTKYFAHAWALPPFLISLIIISLGTNLPELSFIARSLFMKNNQVAFGDYVGSACVNTFLFGVLTLIYDKPVYLSNSYSISLIFLIFGIVLFFFLSKSKNTLTKIEGFYLLCLYLLFLGTEFVIYNNFQ